MTEDTLSETFAALANPTRRQILMRLSLGEATVGELSEPFELSQPAISRHLRVLEAAGLIERRREAQWRPAKLDPEPLKDVDAWLARYRAFWEESFDRLDEYLQKVQGGPKPGSRQPEDSHPAPETS